MDQGVIATVKKLYKKNLVRRLLLSEKSKGAVPFLRDLDLRDCFALLRLAWDDINQSTLQKACKSLLGDSFIPNNVPVLTNIQNFPSNIDADVDEPEFWTDSPSEICNRVSHVLSGPDYSVEESRKFLLEWLENDQNDTDSEWEPLSDSDIVNFVTNGACQPEPVNEIKESQTVFQNPVRIEITTTVAYEGLMKVKDWIKSCPDCSSIDLQHIEELENKINQNMLETSQNKVYLRL